LKPKQVKEREAAGLPRLQRLGARAAAPQRGQRGGPASRGGQRGGPTRAVPIHQGGGHSQVRQGDQTVYTHLIGLLRKKSLLPVVVFTFSKKKCEQNAGTLTNLDLSSAGEKSEIHVTIEKAVMRLKGICRTVLTKYSLSVFFLQVRTRNCRRSAECAIYYRGALVYITADCFPL
jgi:antiviral helicase SKI2